MLAMALLIVAVTGSVLLLSAAGIYAMMSFTVARRRREIGIRSALGADPRHILSGIFARAASQLGAGVLGGLVLAAAAGRAVGGGPLSGKAWYCCSPSRRSCWRSACWRRLAPRGGAYAFSRPRR